MLFFMKKGPLIYLGKKKKSLVEAGEDRQQ